MAKVPKSSCPNGTSPRRFPDQNDGHGYADQIWKPFTKVDTDNIPEGFSSPLALLLPNHASIQFGQEGQLERAKNGKDSPGQWNKGCCESHGIFQEQVGQWINKGQQDNEGNGAEQGSNLV